MEPDDQPHRDKPFTAQRPRGPVTRLWPRRWRYRALLVCLGLLLVSGSATWLARERIAVDLIDSYLGAAGVDATYKIVEITPTRQVIENLAVGDPAQPDLTAERLVVEVGYGLTGPAVQRVRVAQARLFGTLRGSRLSFGALDPLVFTGSKEPAALPALAVVLEDARARIDTNYGAIAAKLAGAGRLDDGFAGILAVTAPDIGNADCLAERATLFGALTTRKGQPAFEGPIRLAGVRCAGLQLARADIGSKLSLATELDALTGEFAVAAQRLVAGDAQAARLDGTAGAAISARGLVFDHDVTLRQLALPQAVVGQVSAAGSWRAMAAQPGAATRSEWSGTIGAQGLAFTSTSQAALDTVRKTVAGTLLEPLAGRFADALTRELGEASLTSEAIIRRSGNDLRLIVPEARLRSGSGQVMLAFSQFNWGLTAGGGSGNFIAGGAGLPRLNGRLDNDEAGGFALRLAMADYAVSGSSLAIPRLSLRQSRGGDITLSGLVRASGPVPGGVVKGLEVPLEGRWSKSGGLWLGERCHEVRFASLSLAALDMAGEQLSLCPAGGSPMLRYDDSVAVSIATSRLNLSGALDGTPARFAAGSATLLYPGVLSLDNLTVELGAPDNQSRLTLASLTGNLGGTAAGAFTGAVGQLAAVPLDLSSGEGRWHFAEGVLGISDARFRLSDRTEGKPRFEALAGQMASLQLSGDTITASAALYHPASSEKVARVSLIHDLAEGAGHADLVVDKLTFGRGLDVENLTYLAKGVIAFASGAVSGEGRVEWAGERVSSEGRFRTDGLDFAAAFGPVRGLRGEVVFTDLLALTTAPDQRLEIAAINTGVEVLDGRIRFAMTDGTLITLADARWPFMGGELAIRPVVLDFGKPSEKRYVFDVSGLDAATFVAEMELTNLGADGTFDGTVPIIFDARGNGRVDNGVLRARAPGGNISYVGELSYEDMGAISNYAFRALRSLDYREMSVVLDGSLTGEIISKFQFDGVRQGAGANRNFVTRKLAQLPILFRVNVKSESFYELSTVVRSFFDISLLGNPIDRGLLRVENGRFVPGNPQSLAPGVPMPSGPPATQRDEAVVQPPESEIQP